MDKRYKDLLSNTKIFAVGSLGAKIILFFLVPLYTHILTTSEYGTVELISTISMLLVPIVSLSIGDAVLRFCLDSKYSSKHVIHNAIIVLLLGSFLLILISPIFNSYQSLSIYRFYLISLTIISAFRISFQYYAKAKGNSLIFSIDSILYALNLALSNLLFLLVYKLSIKGYLLAQLFSGLFSLVLLFFATDIHKNVWSCKFNKHLLNEMVHYSFPLVFNSLSWWIIHSIDKIMLSSIVSIDAVGVYSVASQIPSIINTITYFFSQAWVIAAIQEYDSNKDVLFYSKTFNLYSSFLFLSVSLFLLILRPFMLLYVGKAFNNSWRFVPLLLIATIFRNFSDFFGAFFSSAKKNVIVMLTTIIGALTNILLNYLLIPKYGIQGAVLGTLGSYLVVAIYRIVSSRKIIPINLKIKKLFFSFCLLLLQCYFLIYKESFGSCLLCFLLLCFSNKDELFIVLRKMYSIVLRLGHSSKLK